MYELTHGTDDYLLGGSAALLLGDYWKSTKIKPLTLAEINSLDFRSLLSIDQSTVFRNHELSSDISDYFRDGINLVPFTLMLSQQGRKEWKTIGVMYVETILANAAITSAIKLLANRKRPFVYNPDVALELKTTTYAKRSFLSGHTSQVSSLSFFTASVLDDLYPDSSYKALWWGAAISIPAVTAYLRYNTGKHFPTDVVAGYALGAAIGYVIPKFHKICKTESNVDVTFYGSGIGLTVSLN